MKAETYLEAARAVRALRVAVEGLPTSDGPGEIAEVTAEQAFETALAAASTAAKALDPAPLIELLLALLEPAGLNVLAEALEDEAGVSRCRGCGCTDLDACLDPTDKLPCSWVEDDLCSACAGTREVRHA